MDPTSKMPNEILMKIFDLLPSLRDKLRAESVSHRFQRCLLNLLNTKPIPLVFDSEKMELNGYEVWQYQLPDAVQTLASKAKLNRIELNHAPRKRLNKILTALVTLDNDRLDKVTTFQVLSRTGARGGLVTEVLAKCAKLADVRINWSSADLEKLQLALKEKQITRLSVSLQSHSQQQLAQLYRSVKPKILKKIGLDLFEMTLDVGLLVTALYGSAWAAVEEIDFQWQEVNFDIVALFSSLPVLPSLRKCNFVLNRNRPTGELNLTSLFTNQIEIKFSYYFGLSDGCELVRLVRQLQLVHPDVQVGFAAANTDACASTWAKWFCSRKHKLTLMLGKVCFELDDAELIQPCSNFNCAECGIFYPVVCLSLKHRASERVQGVQLDGHLANCRLDRCRVGSVVAHLNQESSDPINENGELWIALDAGMNETQNLATITFESLVAGIGQFQITVDCGPCLTNGCLGCVNVG